MSVTQGSYTFKMIHTFPVQTYILCTGCANICSEMACDVEQGHLRFIDTFHVFIAYLSYLFMTLWQKSMVIKRESLSNLLVFADGRRKGEVESSLNPFHGNRWLPSKIMQ